MLHAYRRAVAMNLWGWLPAVLLAVSASCRSNSFSAGGASAGNRDSLAPPIHNLTLKWKFAALGRVRFSPLVGQDGSSFISDSLGHLYKVDPAGNLSWLCDTQNSISSQLCLLEQQHRIYAAAADGRVHAVDTESGVVEWAVRVSSIGISAAPVGTLEGHLVLGTRCGAVVCLDGHTGEERWRHRVGAEVGTSLTVADDGTVYVAVHDGRLYALNPDGPKRVWVVRIGANHMSAPAVNPLGGQVVIGNDHGRVLAVDSRRGLMHWNVSVHREQPVYMTPVYDNHSGVLLLGSTQGLMLGVHPSSGELLWRAQLGVFMGSPVSVSGGRFYVSSRAGCVISASSQHGTELTRFCSGGEVYSSPAVAPDGTVFLCSEDGHLYALTGQCGHECHHGRCDLHSGRCVCQAPYRGPNCAELCPGDVLNQSGKVVSCSGHGVCHTESRSCRCAEGYTAHNCAQAECPKNCSGHGVCTSGSCGCLEPFLGQDCSRVHYHTGCMYLTALCVALAVMLGSGVLCPGEHSQEVERFKQLYASTQPERLLGGAHHFGVYKPARFERAAYHVQNPAFSRVLERRAGPETGSVESPTRSSMQRRPAHLCVVPRNWDED